MEERHEERHVGKVRKTRYFLNDTFMTTTVMFYMLFSTLEGGRGAGLSARQHSQRHNKQPAAPPPHRHKNRKNHTHRATHQHTCQHTPSNKQPQSKTHTKHTDRQSTQTHRPPHNTQTQHTNTSYFIHKQHIPHVSTVHSHSRPFCLVLGSYSFDYLDGESKKTKNARMKLEVLMEAAMLCKMGQESVLGNHGKL